MIEVIIDIFLKLAILMNR